MRRRAARVVADWMESLANVLREKTGEATSFEARLWEELSYLQGTYEYQSTGVPGEKCDVDCDAKCWRCAGGDPNYRGEDLWY